MGEELRQIAFAIHLENSRIDLLREVSEHLDVLCRGRVSIHTQTRDHVDPLVLGAAVEEESVGG
eukprot:9996870-Prorocentrum_lima.AAC.1